MAKKVNNLEEEIGNLKAKAMAIPELELENKILKHELENARKQNQVKDEMYANLQNQEKELENQLQNMRQIEMELAE